MFVLARSCLACAIVVLASSSLYAQSLVYDNGANPVKSQGLPPDDYKYCPNGFWPFLAFETSDEMGNQITLAGADRKIVQFDLYLSSTKPVDLAAVTLSFYRNDGFDSNDNSGAPGTELWSGSIDNVHIEGPRILTFYVTTDSHGHDGTVPTTFTWAASGICTDAEPLAGWDAGLATYYPPVLGSSKESYWDHAIDGKWYYMDFENDPVANFGAKIWAVPESAPEPGSLALLTLGGLALLRRQRGR